MPGLETVLGNLNKQVVKMEAGAAAAADEIADLLEAYAKTNAPFTDQTGHLRASIDGSWEVVSKDVVRIYLSAGMEYAVWVETLRSGKYAYLWPALVENRDRAMQIFEKHLRL